MGHERNKNKIKQGHERESGRARGSQGPPGRGDLWPGDGEGSLPCKDLGHVSQKEPERAQAWCVPGRAGRAGRPQPSLGRGSSEAREAGRAVSGRALPRGCSQRLTECALPAALKRTRSGHPQDNPVRAVRPPCALPVRKLRLGQVKCLGQGGRK